MRNTTNVIITMSIDELRTVLEKAENQNKYHGMSHTIMIGTDSHGSAYIELLSQYAECNSTILLKRK
jgi:hypothetical protein